MATVNRKPTRDAEKSAPVATDETFIADGGLLLNIKYSLQSGKPVITFKGKWTTRDFKNILRAIPRAYRQNQVNLRKQFDALKTQGA